MKENSSSSGGGGGGRNRGDMNPSGGGGGGGGGGVPTTTTQREASQQRLDLPPGFRFHPTDEELVVHYLRNKVSSRPLPVPIIAEVDLYKFDPWDLPGMAICGENEWYFFTPRDRKYPNGARPNRAAGSGYWKATGTDKPVISSSNCVSNSSCSTNSIKVGVKKALVFYRGRPPKGLKTNWIMHEYRLLNMIEPSPKLSSSSSLSTSIFNPRRSLRLDDWVLCRIYRKSNHDQPRLNARTDSISCDEETLPSLLVDHENPHQEAKSLSMGIQLYNDLRPLQRLGSFGRLIMSGTSMPDSILDGLVTDQISSPTMNIANDSSNSWVHLAHLSSTFSSQAINNNMVSLGGRSLFTRETDNLSKHNNSTSTNDHQTILTPNSQTVGLNIGLPNTLLPPAHTPQHRQQLKDPNIDNNFSVDQALIDNNQLRWPFPEGRTRFA